MTWFDRVLKWIEPETNPRNTIYGTLAAGLVIAAEDPRTETYVRVVTATVTAVAIYWLAHGYADWVGHRLADGDRTGDSSSGLVAALRREWPLAEGAAIPFATLLVSWAVGAPLTTGVPAAVWSAAAALVLFETTAALRRRLPARQLLTNAGVGLALGGALLGIKLLLH